MIIEWFFILIVLLPTGGVEITQLGRFDSEEDCKTVETLLPMKLPSTYIRFEIIPCWKNTFKIEQGSADKDKHETKK